MSDIPDYEYMLWCRHTFEMLAPGGIWAVPRSGLIFRKHETEQTLTLTEAMSTLEALDDYEEIRKQFAGAGITVESLVDWDR